MKIKISILLLSITLIGLAVAGARKSNGFEPASDLPRGALVYVQVENLPEFIKLVSESDQYKTFASGETMAAFSNGHLGIKLASRLKEFSNSAGFDFDAGTLSTLADKRAALALYDIGKLDFAIVAPMSDTVFQTTQLALNRGKFDSEKLLDGSTLYRTSARQAQRLIFTHSRGRLIVSTRDDLIRQALINIEGKRGMSSLADEPSFKALASDLKPRLAAVWVDQAALNGDYYFKHYWLMSDHKELATVRAGLFDIGIDERSVSERRVFLTDGIGNERNLDARSVADALKFIPTDAPLYSVRSADPASIDKAIGEALFTRKAIKPVGSTTGGSSTSIYGDKFEMAIDEEIEVDAPIETAAPRPISELFAKPRSIVTFSRPKILESPLFFETDRAVIVTLADARKFDQAAFETLIGERFASERSVGSDRFKWRSENGWRVLDLPFLGAGARYRIEGANILLTNGFELSGGSPTSVKDGEFSELTVVNLDQRNTAFDKVFEDFQKRGAEVRLMTSNVAGLLDSAAPARRLEIRKRASGKLIEETIVAER